MGALKQSVIDTEQEDQTDPRDPGVYPGEENEKPSDEDLAVGHAMQDLAQAVGILEKYKPYSEYAEIDGLSARLTQLVADMDKPF